MTGEGTPFPTLGSSAALFCSHSCRYACNVSHARVCSSAGRMHFLFRAMGACADLDFEFVVTRKSRFSRVAENNTYIAKIH